MKNKKEGKVIALHLAPVKRPTIDDVLKIPGFESLSAPEAEQLLDDLELLCRISMATVLNLTVSATLKHAA